MGHHCFFKPIAADKRARCSPNHFSEDIPMRLISFLVYIPLQIAFIPLAFVGVALVGYRHARFRAPQRRRHSQSCG